MDHPNQQASVPMMASDDNHSPPSGNQTSGTDIHQALFQSIAAQGTGHGHSNSFAGQGSNLQGQGHNPAFSLPQMDLVQQLIGMGGDNKNNSGNNTAVPFPQQGLPNSVPQAQDSGNNNIVSQLVATLQAQQVQQQSQQQAQVQAAISRAFGPSSVGGAQQQLPQQQPNNQNNILNQMQIAQAQGMLNGNNSNFLPNLGMGNNVQNNMFLKRAMMAGGQDANKKQKLDTSLPIGNGNLFNPLPSLPNSLFPNSVPGMPNMLNNTIQDNLQQKLAGARGAVIVPCRARGMPVDHNFKTAYFVIPDGIEHGDELVCSYPACRQAGVKFRYCVDCKVPVAKRNFRNRHKHGNLGEKKKGSPTQEKKDANMEEKDAEIEAVEGKSEERRSSEELSDETENESDLKPSASPVKAETNTGSNQTTVSISSKHDPNQVQQWVSLLDNKPDPSDKEAMAVWMMNLMHATDAMSSKTESAALTSEEASERNDSKPEVPELPVKKDPEVPELPVKQDNETSELKSEGAGELKSEETAAEKTADI